MSQLKNYMIVTSAYWSFMLTDGVLRMLTLLYFHQQGYSPSTLAFLFLFYEFFGIITNLLGGRLAYYFGLKSTLVSGLLLQVFAIIMLSLLQSHWQASIAVPYVMACQALSGIAKDLTKMSSKTAIKYLIPEDKSSMLFKWVAILTGSKNAIKGCGFFIGGLLLQTLGFQIALQSMAALIAIAFSLSIYLLPKEIGKAKSKNKLSGIFDQNQNIKLLSAARIFLFGARDIWFVVAIPVYLTSTFNWSFTEVGSFMAIWVIMYGFIQAISPTLLHFRNKKNKPCGRTAFELASLLCICMTIIATCFITHFMVTTAIVIGLYLFGAIFAVNSSVHSFLILDYADNDKAVVNVGFYYMANAMGRLIGTLLSGLLYQAGGISYCLVGSVLFLACSAAISLKLPQRKQALL